MRTSLAAMLRRTLVALALVGSVLAVVPSTAQAYGKVALWQIGASFNCNNPDFCGPELGGFWAWAEFDSGGQGDATATGCGHLSSPGGPGLAGADHLNIEITGWTIAPGSGGPLTFFITAGTVTSTGHSGGPPVTVPILAPIDTGFPALPGHYTATQLFGFTPPPGVAVQIQVVQLTH
jgi:hypothetical protein